MDELKQLTLLETRVLGVLVEKEITVPDSYPLTLNSLVSGCNQKSSRDPLMNITETEVKESLDELRRRSLIMETSGGRAWRYAHNVPKGLGLSSAETAIIAALWMRGPQTSGELRINAERFYRFADLSSVEAYLEDMATKTPSRVLKLPRQQGAREARWTHLYSGIPVVEPEPESQAPPTRSTGALAELARRVEELEEKVSKLESELGAIKSVC
ncbi:MAG: YceH family protein [Burkholderiales bacterium]